MSNTPTERHPIHCSWSIDPDGDVKLLHEPPLFHTTYLAPIDVLRMMARLLDVEVGELKMDLVDKYSIAIDDMFAEGGD